MLSSAKYENNKRIYLDRIWDFKKPVLNILMYRPSSADAKKNDITIQRCIDISKFNDYGGIKVYNLNMYNNMEGSDVLIAWGNKIKKKESNNIISKLKNKYTLLCFKKLKNGNPGLPTRLSKFTKIKKYTK